MGWCLMGVLYSYAGLCGDGGSGSLITTIATTITATLANKSLLGKAIERRLAHIRAVSLLWIARQHVVTNAIVRDTM